jgi:hypothetical protein
MAKAMDQASHALASTSRTTSSDLSEDVMGLMPFFSFVILMHLDAFSVARVQARVFRGIVNTELSWRTASLRKS